MFLSSSYLPCLEGQKPHSMNSCKTDSSNVKPGHCPICRLQFRQPVALPCGHSMCRQCCEDQLTKYNGSTVAARRRTRHQTVLMGIGAVNKHKKHKNPKLQKALSSIKEFENDENRSKFFYLSPGCPVCYSGPKFQPPVPNHALEKLLIAWERYTVSQRRTSMKKQEKRELSSPTPSSTSSSGFEENDEQIKASTPTIDFSIRKCNIAVLGAVGVGKSRLVRAQHLNKLFFGRIGVPSKDEDDLINPVAELQAKYMIEILDNNDIDGDLADADAVILAYACNNHDSFVSAFKIYEEISKRGFGSLPLILVATKCDIDLHRREIKSEEAESLARHIGCPHMEVSAKKNIGVNEVFTELVRLIETKYDLSTTQTN